MGAIVNHIRSFCTVSGRTVTGSTGLEEPYLSLNDKRGGRAYLLDGVQNIIEKLYPIPREYLGEQRLEPNRLLSHLMNIPPNIQCDLSNPSHIHIGDEYEWEEGPRV